MVVVVRMGGIAGARPVIVAMGEVGDGPGPLAGAGTGPVAVLLTLGVSVAGVVMLCGLGSRVGLTVELMGMADRMVEAMAVVVEMAVVV